MSSEGVNRRGFFVMLAALPLVAATDKKPVKIPSGVVTHNHISQSLTHLTYKIGPTYVHWPDGSWEYIQYS